MARRSEGSRERARTAHGILTSVMGRFAAFQVSSSTLLYVHGFILAYFAFLPICLRPFAERRP